VALRALPRKEDAGIRKACVEVGRLFPKVHVFCGCRR
jgi:hypothetical protein